MHKFKPSDRVPLFGSVVSSVGTYSYNLAKFLGNMLGLYIFSDYSVKDTFTFVKEIKRVSTMNKFLVSFDIFSLFTDIP